MSVYICSSTTGHPLDNVVATWTVTTKGCAEAIAALISSSRVGEYYCSTTMLSVPDTMGKRIPKNGPTAPSATGRLPPNHCHKAACQMGEQRPNVGNKLAANNLHLRQLQEQEYRLLQTSHSTNDKRRKSNAANIWVANKAQNLLK